MPETEGPGRDGFRERDQDPRGDGTLSREGGTPSRGGSPEEGADDISLVRLLNVLLRHRRLVLGLPVAAAVLLVTVALVLPRSYTADAAFLPEAAEQDVTRLAGLAAQFGFSVPGGRGGETPEFYADLLRSRELLKAAVQTRYDLGPSRENPDGHRGDLVEYYRVEHEPREAAVAKTIERLRDDLHIRTRPETGVVELAVTTRSPVLSHQVASRMLELVNEFNLERRQSQAAAERTFIESRLAEAEESLQSAEDDLEAFLQRNRRYQNAPDLVFEFERRQRRVSLRQQVYTSLSQSYEQARIEEVRNTPVVTVVSPPEAPSWPDPRRLPLKGILGLLLGGVVGVTWAFGREFLSTARERERDDYVEFERLKAETAEELKDGWVRVRRKVGRGRPA